MKTGANLLHTALHEFSKTIRKRTPTKLSSPMGFLKINGVLKFPASIPNSTQTSQALSSIMIAEESSIISQSWKYSCFTISD